MHTAVVNLKGGVGKTTTAVHLAHVLSGTGRTLLVDADPQGSCLSWSELAGGFPYGVVGLPVRNLPKLLQEVSEGYTHVVIDTPPGEGDKAITRSALMASDEVIVPVAPTTMDLNRFEPTLDLLAEVDDLHPLTYRVLLTRVRANTRNARDTRELLAGRSVPVIVTEIPLLEAYASVFGATPTAVTLDRYAAVLAELAGVPA